MSFLNKEGNVIYLRNNLRKSFLKKFKTLDKKFFINSNNKIFKKFEIGPVYTYHYNISNSPCQLNNNAATNNSNSNNANSNNNNNNS